jgi:hypothetical protein
VYFYFFSILNIKIEAVMKFNKLAIGFFSCIGAAAVTGIAFTIKGAKNCSALTAHSLDLLQTFLDSEIGVQGNLNMDVQMGNSEYLIPIAGHNLTLNVSLKLNEQLINKLKTFPMELMENSCKAAVYQSGISDVALLLTLAAAVTGAVISYRYLSNKPPVDAGDVAESLIEQPHQRVARMV